MDSHPLSGFPGWPRLLTRARAAEYLSMSLSRFEARVRAGHLPKALPLGNPQLWDRDALDRSIDRLSHIRRAEHANDLEAVALAAIKQNRRSRKRY